MTVQELIDILKKHNPQSKVCCTWEGQIIDDIDVYCHEDGRVLIDSDESSYKVQHQGIMCTVCGDYAKGFYNNLPVCYKHWRMG